jgi:signal transduction histidine kinase
MFARFLASFRGRVETMPAATAPLRLRIPPPPRITRFQAYVSAVVIPLATVVIQRELVPLVYLVPFTLFFLAVFLVSWLGGRGPGFVAIGLSAVLADYHFLPPDRAFSLEPRVVVVIALFCLVSTIVNLLTTAAVEAYVEAQRAIQMRDDFLSVAGHELRTPLGTLRLQIETLTRLARAQPGTVPENQLARAERNVDRLVRLVDQLLDVSRIRAGRLEMHLESCDLSDIARTVVDSFRDAAAHAGNDLVLETADGVVGKWDRSRLEHVVSNLVGNAIKFGAGKTIEVRTAIDGGRARLSVADHGVGIAPDEQGRIFGRFQQGRLSRDKGGLGLGLWITRRMVDAHGGTIAVKSNPGEGSTFTVELPLVAPGAEAATRGAGR